MLAPSTRLPRPAARRGAILLVVLTLLALFAVVGLGFALYAESEASASRIKRESVDSVDANTIDATQFVNAFLSQLVYDVGDTGQDTLSDLRGQALATLMYGKNPAFGFDATLNATLPPSNPNMTPYNGHGLFTDPNFSSITPAPPSGLTDRRQVVRFSVTNTSSPLFDPEHNGARNPATQVNTLPGLVTLPSGNPRTYVAKNAGYTYPDRNNMAVAVVNPSTGQVMIPSFLRPLLFDGTGSATASTWPTTTLGPGNPNWATPSGRYKGLRPRPFDQLTFNEQQTLASATGVAFPFQDTLTTADITSLISQYNIQVQNGTINSPAMPFPSANPDGTFTGDVQNLLFADGIQKNDSIWMWANMPVITYKGKRVTALVAPLVIPLDGAINMTVAGNLNQPGSMGAPPGHISHQGFGPWEIGLSNLIPNTATTFDYATIKSALYGSTVPPSPKGTSVTSLPFYQLTNPTAKPGPTSGLTTFLPQDYARIDWDAFGSSVALQMPSSTTPLHLFRSDPFYPPGMVTPGTPPPGYDAGYATGVSANGATTTATTEAQNHPGLFNPYFWDTGSGPGKLFAFRDLVRDRARYAYKAGYYNAPFLGLTSSSSTSLNGNSPAATANPVISNPNFRRAVLTTISNSLKRPVLPPNYSNAGFLQTLQPSANTYQPQYPQTAGPDLGSTTNPVAGSALNDLPTSTGQQFLRNVRTALSAVNLNRALTDYRTDTDRPLADSTNLAGMSNQSLAATFDRIMLARDIFIRLIVATGAKAIYDSSTGQLALPDPTNSYTLTYGTTTTTVASQDYDVLRYLAQLSVNIVDYIDPDDVSTPFVWNPSNPAAVSATNPLNQTDFAVTGMPGDINDRVVFGVEKPKVVLNEIYAEVANSAADATSNSAAQPFQVRFWVEMVNTGNKETAVPPAGPGATQVFPALTGPDNTQPGSVPLRFPAGAGATSSVYKIQIYQNGGAVRAALQGQQNNVLGNISAAPAVLAADFLGNASDSSAPGLADMLEPNDGQASAAAGQRNGFMVIGPNVTTARQTSTQEFLPTATLDPRYGMIVTKNESTSPPMGGPPPDAMSYTITPVPEAQYQANVLNMVQDHGIVLQRLANPYLPQSPTNPYLTVDYLTHVYAYDAVRVMQGMPGTRSSTQPDPATSRRAVGRVAPHGGWEGTPSPATPIPPPAMNMAKQYPVLSYNPTTGGTPSMLVNDYTAPAVGSGPIQTLFQHNSVNATTLAATSPTGDNTLKLPFQWFTHLDRPLINESELLHVSGVKPYEATHFFAAPGAGGTQPMFHNHVAPWTGANSLLYRGLELLTVKPWMYGIPDGGRTPGRVNLNMVWDGNLLNALLDPQSSNGFTANNDIFDPTQTTANNATKLWGRLFAGDGTGTPPANTSPRTPGWPNVGETSDDNPASTTPDRPFKSFGAPTFNGVAGSMAPNAVQGLGSTLLRTSGSTSPLIMLNSATATHPYLQAEALRKMLNNVTTVSDTYLVLMTVGFFEVRGDDPTVPSGTFRPLLGREVYNQIPGDLRVQYAAVIDRTNLSLPVIGNSTAAVTAGGSVTVQVSADSTQSGTLVGTTVNGQQWKLAMGSTVTFGDGPTAEQVTVTGVSFTPPPPQVFFNGTVTFTVANAHRAGEPLVIPNLQGPRPWYTTLATSAPLGQNQLTINVNGGSPAAGGTPGFVTVNYEGQTVGLVEPNSSVTPATPGSFFRVGTGADAEWVQLNQVVSVNTNTGTAVISVTTPLSKSHGAGSAISAAVLGNPGPQPAFDFGLQQYSAVIPYVGRAQSP